MRRQLNHQKLKNADGSNIKWTAKSKPVSLKDAGFFMIWNLDKTD